MTAVRGTVLLIEDEPDLLATLADLISQQGYLVLEAEHGAAALTLLRREAPPGLVIVDLATPVMNGIRFREEQLADPRIAGIPTVAMTASRPSIWELAHLRFDGILFKPFVLPELFAVLERHCGPHRGAEPGLDIVNPWDNG